MNRLLCLCFIAISLLLTACATDQFRNDVKPEEIQAVAKRPVLSTPFRKAGIDFWLMGVPKQKYRVLGIIDDKRRNTPFIQQTYYRDIARIVKERGGDAAIDLVGEDSVETTIANDCREELTSENYCGDASGASLSRYAPGQELSVYSLNRGSTSVPLEYRDTHMLVIKYLK